MTGNDVFWISSHFTPELTDQDVHLWLLALDLEQAAIEARRAILSDDERKRADRFLHDESRFRFIACRGQVREILGHYLHVKPSNLLFSQNAYGKPEIALPARSGFHFNVSHCRQWALLAVSADREVGIDLEFVRPIDDLPGMVRQCLAPEEQMAWNNLSPDDRLPGFFRAWTAKEAVLKLVGRGLSIPMNRIPVLAPTGETRRVVPISRVVEGMSECSIEGIPVPPGCLAAIAFSGQLGRLVPGLWSPS